jgi:hypothetical protein
LPSQKGLATRAGKKKNGRGQAPPLQKSRSRGFKPLLPSPPSTLSFRGSVKARLRRYIRKMYKKIKIIFLFPFFLFLSIAQSAELRLDFSQDNRTYVWHERLSYDHHMNKNFRLSLSTFLNSTLIKSSFLTSGPDRWQEDGKLSLRLSNLLNPKLDLGTLFAYDLNSLEQRNVSTQTFGLFCDYKIFPYLSFYQTLGYKGIQREWSEPALGEQKKPDKGYNYSTILTFTPEIYGSKAFLTLNQETERFKNIPTTRQYLTLFYSKVISPYDSINVDFQQSRSKNKYYARFGSSKINTQKKSTQAFKLFSSKELFWNFQMDARYDYAKEEYHYILEPDTVFDPFSITDNSISSQNFTINIKREYLKRFIVEGFYRYAEIDENYGDVNKNQKMKSGEAGAKASSQITKSDSLYLVGSIGVTSFYTPFGSVTFNDRDILTKLGNLEYFHIFSPFLDLRFQLGFKNFHQVYISNRLSANNNYNETYILSPTLNWRPSSKLILIQNYSIQANYISYDYEKKVQSPRNKIFRRGSSSSNITYIYNRRLNFRVGYLYRYEDYGQLLWRNQWVEMKSWERKTQIINLGLDYKVLKKVVLSPGYSFEKRKEWDLTTENKKLSYEFFRNMLSLALDYHMGLGNYLKFSGTHRFQKEKPGRKDQQDFFSVSLVYAF